MLESIYQIDFIDESGVSMRLLNYGDLIADPIDLPVQQSVESFNSLAALWGGSQAGLGARRPVSWSRVQEHPNHATAASFCIYHPAMMPFSREGKLRFSISGGDVWDMLDAVILSASTRVYTDGDYATITSYHADAAQTLPVSGLAWFAGIPAGWILTTFAAQTRTFSAT